MAQKNMARSNGNAARVAKDVWRQRQRMWRESDKMSDTARELFTKAEEMKLRADEMFASEIKRIGLTAVWTKYPYECNVIKSKNKKVVSLVTQNKKE